MKTKKPDPNQLWLDFEKAVETHRESTDNLVKTVRALHESPEVTQESKKKARKILSDERKMFNRLVAVAAFRNNRGRVREVYARIYHELKVKTGFDAYAHLEKHNTPCVEAVEAHGYMGEALKIAQGVL